MNVHDILEEVLRVEGERYTNNPLDSGGPTKWGWTEKALRAEGYTRAVKDLTRQEAYDLYYRRFVIRSGYHAVLQVSPAVAAELVDTAVNMGELWAGKILQQSLNAFNLNGTRWPDIQDDGAVGPATLSALKAFLAHRGREGEQVLLKAMNCLQGARYIELSQSGSKKNEAFLYGWLRTRVAL